MLLSKNIEEPKKKYFPPMQNYFKFLVEPLKKAEKNEEEIKSEESSAASEEGIGKGAEVNFLENYEKELYDRILTLLKSLS